MFVILVYDVESKRDIKVLKIARRYLYSVQESVFEGPITDSKLKKMKKALEQVIDPEYDSIRIYETESSVFSKIDTLGNAKKVEFSVII